MVLLTLAPAQIVIQAIQVSDALLPYGHHSNVHLVLI